MRSLWLDSEAARHDGLLHQRVYSSRLLGREPALVLHGGGNTSVKITERDVFGEEREILYVKGSGADLAVIDENGFTPLELAHVRRLGTLEHLADPDMVRELASHCTRPGAPAASIEAILHALMPYRFVDHTHADAVLAVTNTANGAERIEEIYGDEVLVIPYVMPGFALARTVAQAMTGMTPATRGIVLMNHGIFTFGDTARESYERMIALVTRAEEYLAQQDAWQITLPPATPVPHSLAIDIAMLREEISIWARRPMIVRTYDDDRIRAFTGNVDMVSLSQHGPATPDHIIRTKRVPMIGRDVNAYVSEYYSYFNRNAALSPEPKTELDPAPRVVLDPHFGLCAIGKTPREAAIVGDIYSHTIDTILRATALGGYQALPERDLFEIEYWDLEQAKLRGGGNPPPLTGEIALVTGAASGIGAACVNALMARGAAVVGLDINPEIVTMHARQDYLGIVCDVTDEAAVERAIDAAVKRFGGIDIVVPNAGIFPKSTKIADLPAAEWQRVMNLNADSVLTLLRCCYPMLKEAPRNGRVAVVASRNVPAPGPGAAAYSASKAALTQLARVAALEWGADRITVNIVHPHAVFDTGIWTSDVLTQRAEQYGLSVQEYKSRNILGVEITSSDVGELVAELCGPTFAKITGAQIPIDGGNDRVI